MFTKHQSALDEAVSESRGKIGHCESMFTSRGTGPVFVDLVCNPGKTAAQVINSFAAQMFFLGVSGKPVPSCPIHQENLQENPKACFVPFMFFFRIPVLVGISPSSLPC